MQPTAMTDYSCFWTYVFLLLPLLVFFPFEWFGGSEGEE